MNDNQINAERLQKLKANVQVWNIQKYIDKLRSEWKPEVKTVDGVVPHGSNKGMIIQYELYWNEYSCSWTDKDSAFKGFVFKNVSKELRS